MLFHIDPLRLWVHKVLPVVYDDSLSYYEVLAKVTKKLNEVIDLTEEQNQYIEEFSTNLTNAINHWEDGMEQEWSSYKSGLNNEWGAFQRNTEQYIENWKNMAESDIEDAIAAGINQFVSYFSDLTQTAVDAAERAMEAAETAAQDAVDAVMPTLENQFDERYAWKTAVGSPLVATTAAGMTDTTKVYVYAGSETGYVNGDWYYYDGTAWQDGGVYNSAAVVTDTTLSEAGVPADAKAAGDEIDKLKSAIYTQSNTPFVAGSINYETGANDNRAAQQQYRLRTNGIYDNTNANVAISLGNYYFTVCVFRNTTSGTSAEPGTTYVGVIQNDGTIKKDTDVKWHQTFYFPENNDYYYRFVLRIGTTTNIDISPTEASNFLLLIKQSDKADKQIYYDRIEFNGVGRYIWCGNHEIASGSTIYFRPVSHATSRGQTGVTLYGIYEAAQSGGYDNLAHAIPDGDTQILKTTRAYHHLQAAAQNNGGGTGEAAAFSFDILIIPPNTPKYGIQSDLAEISLRTAFNRSTCKIFKKVVCCGDSYTSGYIKLDTDSNAIRVNEEFAWPHYMSTATGNNWVNCGSSGANVLSWQTAERGLPKAQTEGAAQAYVIGLMINDVPQGANPVPLGTIDDIGTDAETYYGGMSKIIRELNTISPLAKIFVNTCPRTDRAGFTDYNQAVRDIVETYKNTYPVFCIDLDAMRDIYDFKSLQADAVQGHYTAIGYEQFAEVYEYILSRYIDDHITDFQNVHKIPYGT